MNIFEKREAFKPFEYPEVCKFRDAINHSYWLVSEWNFVSDVNDFKVKLTAIEQNAIKNALLAISQIEVSVKRFWANIGNRFPKAEIEQVGITFAECFADNTEILTPTGWRFLSEVNVGDEVVQFNSNNTFNITKVKYKTNQFYTGPMYRFSKKTTEVIVTPNHRMLYYDNKGNYKETLAENFSVTNSNNKIPEAGILIGKETILSFKDRLRIAIQADGNRRYYNSGYGKKLRKANGIGAEYEIRIKKERKIKRLDWILDNIEDVKYSKRAIPSKEGMFCYTIRIDNEYDYKEMNWVNLTDKSHLWCEEFVQELAEWDGHRLSHKKDCKIKFSSTNKLVTDIVQAVGVCAGYRTNIIKYTDKRKVTYKPVYIVSFTNNRNRVTVPPLKSEIIDYSGFVFCVTVESGAIITRYNNKTFISGNSEVRHADAYSHLLEVLGLNNEFDQLLQNPYIQGRVDYLTKYLKGASDNSNENYTLTLTLFSIFIENVSLFSQFLIIKSFNKYKNVLKDTDNVVQATQKEEVVHALFGSYLINQIKAENPAWVNSDFYDKLYRACKKAFDAECRIIDWILEAGDLPFLSKNTVKEYIKNRFNDSLQLVGGEKLFDVDTKSLEQIKWFDEEILSQVNTDFFHKKPVTYSKKVQSINAEDLF